MKTKKKKKNKGVCSPDRALPWNYRYYMLFDGKTYCRKGHSARNDNLLVFSSFDKAEKCRAMVESVHPHIKTVEVSIDTLLALLCPCSPLCFLDGISMELSLASTEAK